MTFEWNNKKDEANKEKHGIAFEDAVFVFQDPFLLETYDRKHSTWSEDRWKAVGFAERFLCVVYTERFGNIRIISARVATDEEINEYYQKNYS